MPPTPDDVAMLERFLGYAYVLRPDRDGGFAWVLSGPADQREEARLSAERERAGLLWCPNPAACRTVLPFGLPRLASDPAWEPRLREVAAAQGIDNHALFTRAGLVERLLALPREGG